MSFAPVIEENVPAGQGIAESIEKLGQKKLLGQRGHAVAPKAVDNVPGGHGDGVVVPCPHVYP